ncbi:NAD-binding protein [Fomitiporia mediterranea MF3/22]|uniref:NAD-binding protein n=1 Tax=Fomitiporia mediterranea (strain MF3/22) TaxID=694068 RepID=UPI000440926C|nr:NAD-binding protein [Fomitiporia mediterranea MF3/22]EJD04629.1 NAD-binding protein [Fomitiporia mediterranea MF3/22]
MSGTFKGTPAVDSTAIFQPNLFSGKVLFCTGGGSGICRTMTEAIMKHGADAVIVGRKAERLASAAQEMEKLTGKRCIPAQADVRKPEQLKEAVKKAIDTFGRIDFVICGAAGNFLAPISGLSENGFKTVIEIDTIGTYNTIKATLPYVRKAHGSYIHVSATLHYRGTPFQVHVSAAKAGVDAISRVLAVEEGPHGVRSNVIAPGPIGGTEGMDRLSAQPSPSSSSSPSSTSSTAWSSNNHSGIPVARVGDKRDIANAAVFLFSPAASFISGALLVVDGASEHVRASQLPYPQSVLDPESVKEMIKSKL